jgi:hypothetical protein
MTNRVKIIAVGVVLSLSLAIAVPLTYSLAMRLQAKSHVTKGCKYVYNPPTENAARAQFSKAALLDPVYIPLAAAAITTLVDRPTAERYEYLQQWLNGMATIQGVCDNFLNPQSLED